MTAPEPGRHDSGMRLDGFGVMVALCLPRDGLSVPVIRSLVRHALEQVGVIAEVIGDIEVALTEACTNVLDHAGPGDSYEVTVTIRPDRCELRVVDVGHGFDHTTVTHPERVTDELVAERGRGLTLMHALVDDIELVSEPENGTLVRLVKQLTFDEAAPGRRLLYQALHGVTRASTPAAVDPYPADVEPAAVDARRRADQAPGGGTAPANGLPPPDGTLR